MLTELRIADFALIEQLHLVFSQGFHVLTGETGAGKSLLVDALVLLTGGRASSDQIRTHAEEAVLEAAFCLPPTHPLCACLQSLDILSPEEHDLVIRRIISRRGKSRIYVNGHLATLQMIQEFAGSLIDIHSQHEAQSLLSSVAQLEVLDRSGGVQDVQTRYREAFEAWKRDATRFNEWKMQRAEWEQQREFRQFQYRELADAHLQAGEEDTLTMEYQRLKYAGRIDELAGHAYEALYESDQSVLSQLGMINGWVGELAGLDPELAGCLQVSETALVQLRELVEEIRHYREHWDLDPRRLAVIDDRMAKLQRLKKKYGGTIEDLIHQTQTLEEQLNGTENVEEQLERMRKQVDEGAQGVQALARELSSMRRRAADQLQENVQKELASLKMEHVRFCVSIESSCQIEGLGTTGGDRVEFLLSANPGEPLLPLARVASGGELSRVMLAMKTVLAEADQVPVLLFDEVDAGVGGSVVGVMGARLRALSHYHQVLSITHLPQIAAQAHQHYVIEKEVVKNRTVTKVRALGETERREEISRMLGGQRITQTVRQTAEEMLDEAASPKTRVRKKNPGIHS